MMPDTPKVSVIVPVYNARRYLDNCVRSLQAQTEPNIEIILVDDGSTDGSEELCDRFAAGDDRIVVCHQKNGGVSAARNKGLELARGKYVMFCDSDDTVLPRYCQAHLEAMERTGAALTIASTWPLPPEMAPLPGERMYVPDYRLLLKLWEAGWLWCCWGKCYDSRRLRACGVRFHSELAHSEDTIFVVEYITQLMDRPGQICLWQEHLYCYYDTPHSLSKDMKAMAASMAAKQEAACQLDRAVGFEPGELEDLLIPERVGLLNETFRNQLSGLGWRLVRQGIHRTKKAMEGAQFREMVALDRRRQVLGSRYRKVLQTGSPLVIYLYLRVREGKKRLWGGRSVWLSHRRTLVKR